MNFFKTTPRHEDIFYGFSSASGYFMCCLLALVTVSGLSGYARDLLLPEISGGVVTATVLIAVAGTAIAFLYGLEKHLLLSGLGFSALFLLLNRTEVYDSAVEKLEKIATEIYKYTPNYRLTFAFDYEWGLTAITIAAVLIVGITLTTLLLHCQMGAAMTVTAALGIGVFVTNERAPVIYPYTLALCLITMLFISVQAKGTRQLGTSIAVTKIGTKTLAFCLAALLVLTPAVTNEAFSQNITNAIAKVLGIQRIQQVVRPTGGIGDISDMSMLDISMDSYEHYMDDLEEKHSKTDLEDISFQEILLYIIDGDKYEADMFLRRRIYGSYNDNKWELETDSSQGLMDLSVKRIEERIFGENAGDWYEGHTFSPITISARTLAVAAVQPFMQLPIVTGTTEVRKDIYTLRADTDMDGIFEEYPSRRMYTYRLVGPRNDREYFDFLRSIAYKENIVLPDYSVSGNSELDNELYLLAVKILQKYGGYESYEDWVSKPYPVLNATQAVQTFLAETKSYTMNPQKSDNFEKYDHSRDSIYNFLFTTGEGYCVQFASAGTLLLRALGIEARYVTGYVSDYLSRNGYKYVYDSDSHAWCEVFLAGYGWMPFEMTNGAMQDMTKEPILDIPSFMENSETSEESEVSEESSDTSEASEEESDISEVSEESEISEQTSDNTSDTSESTDTSADTSENNEKISKKAIICCISVLGCVIIVLLTVALVHRHNEKRRQKTYFYRKSCADGKGDPQTDLIRLHTQQIKLLALLGFAPLKGEEHVKFVSRVARSDEDLPTIKYASDAFRKAEFGGKPTEEDLAVAAQHLLKLNGYVYTSAKGFGKKRAYFKGILTKPEYEEKLNERKQAK